MIAPSKNDRHNTSSIHFQRNVLSSTTILLVTNNSFAYCTGIFLVPCTKRIAAPITNNKNTISPTICFNLYKTRSIYLSFPLRLEVYALRHLTRRLLSKSNPLKFSSRYVQCGTFCCSPQIHQLPAGVTLDCPYIISINVLTGLFGSNSPKSCGVRKNIGLLSHGNRHRTHYYLKAY